MERTTCHALDSNGIFCRTGTMIEVQNLIVDYPGHRALHGISLQIAAGTVTALVGPNGAGKSTLLRCMAGLESPLAGSVHVAEVDVQENPRRAHQHMGYLSDFFGLYEALSVAQCLQYAAESQGLTRQAAAQRAQAVARQLALTDKLGNAARNLSRGQRQRVAIGQAIIHQPQVLLLDEPASGLDPEARSSLSALFRQLHAQGMTLVVSSHILSELDEYCTHILSIREGRITSHEALNAAPHTSGTGAQAGELVMQVELAAPLANSSTALHGYRLMDMRATGEASHALWIALPTNSDAARVQLLQQLVAHGAQVLSYHPARTSLQERYQQSLQMGTAPIPGAPVDLFAKEPE